jgi:hypothetical protein
MNLTSLLVELWSFLRIVKTTSEMSTNLYRGGVSVDKEN